MSRTLSGTYTSTYRLSSTANNPVTITGNLAGSTGLYGVGGSGQTWTITNAGLVTSSSNGIRLGESGSGVGASSIVNETSHTISGGLYGIYIYSGAPAMITNQAGATILGGLYGINVAGLGATLVNQGFIDGSTTGVDMHGATVTNSVTGTITGGSAALKLSAGSTLINSGTISGSTFLLSASSNRLIANPGAVFSGSVSGGGGTLELTSASSVGTLSITNFTDFSTIMFDAGAKWTITGGSSGLTGLISGFTNLDTIDLTGFVATSDTFATNHLTLTNSGGSHVTLKVVGNFTTGNFQIAPDGTGGTDIIACFVTGTLILTPVGGTPVEQLVAGDLIDTHLGDPMPVRWVGRRHIDCTPHPRPEQAWPVRVRAHAFGPNLPRRDLFLSPNHAVYVNDVLIPIRCLIDGDSIAQVQVNDVVYYHVELPCHDILLAEGLPAESYLDLDGRANFENGEGPMRLFPDFAATSDAVARAWEMQACAPLVVHGPQLASARALVARASQAAAA